jgi:hypothetical protein
MTDKISQRPISPLTPPERFAGGEVLSPRSGSQHVEWVVGQGPYDLGYAEALRRMVEKVAERA